MESNPSRWFSYGAMVIAVLSLAACGGEPDVSKKPADESPEAVVCEVGGDFSGSVTAEATSGAAEEDWEGEDFGPMNLVVVYLESPTESDAVTVVVRDGDGEELTRNLYQIDTPLDEIEFEGGHGFTGLHYVNHDDAQLQYWCAPKK
ncbi:hypothetical protein [Stackebrandtia nassauensis]|uniref:Lipoprotein n=1 Tax=Stackebrandtia nassauensis (strain DSM 44728 / CIP 108903 / NRRL B-16338 / NBRC 102104 / LLR-40K-21) TaxID=446470 RepID=D3QAA1_STANL|nr:hypothetical protein [Stackebrandtia nassauensis]ADD40813.1 hypothetical protein Snas_1103 [Stackebrandtia nassauensis DSM 44728]